MLGEKEREAAKKVLCTGRGDVLPPPSLLLPRGHSSASMTTPCSKWRNNQLWNKFYRLLGNVCVVVNRINNRAIWLCGFMFHAKDHYGWTIVAILDGFGVLHRGERIIGNFKNNRSCRCDL